MDAARWQRVCALFEAAQGQPPPERAEWLARECGEDRALLVEVTSLLANSGDDGDGAAGVDAAGVDAGLLLPRPAAGARDAVAGSDRADAQPAYGRGSARAAGGDDTAEGSASGLNLRVGQEFGRYRVERLLGAGGMGEVYLAEDTGLERKVALKVLGAALDLDLTMVARFRKEAQAGSAVRHASIPVVYEAGVKHGLHFIASEYIEGETLAQRLRQGVLPWREAVRLAEQLARALAVAHAAGIVHRDVKPGNIVIDRAGKPYLVDFGIARRLTGKVEQLTIAGGQLGTPGYMAPEQFFGEEVGPQADLWSLAAVLHAMVTGRPPAAGTPVAQALRSLSRGLAQVLQQALQEDPRRRQASAQVLADQLARLHASGVAGVLARTRSWLPALGALAVAVVVAGWLMHQRASTSHAQDLSLAVLPFDNLGPDRSDDYFALGIEDELETRLVRVSGLRVLDRHAAARAGSSADPASLGRLLQVSHLLEGSVQRRQGRVLVHVRIVDANTQALLWADRYEGEERDVFGIERDVAEAVAAQLRTSLRGEERQAVAAVDTANVQAHEAALRGRELYRRGDEASLRAAVASFEQAVRLDPGYAQAHADLAFARFNLGTYLPQSEQENRSLARAAAQRALALAPGLVDGHVAWGWILMAWDWDLESAGAQFSAALALAPNSPRAINGLAVLSMDLGNFSRAGDLLEQARERDPLSGNVLNNIANLDLATGDVAGAESFASQALRLDPGLADAHSTLFYAALAAGDRQRAAREAQQESAPDVRAYLLALLAQLNGPKAAADQAVRRFEQEFGERGPLQAAALHAQRGERDLAFRWLDVAIRQRDDQAVEILQMPDLAPLYGDPRFAQVCRRIGVPPPTPAGAKAGASA